MSNKPRTPQKIVEKMYQDYLNWVPVVTIAERYGLSLAGVYHLFEREGYPRNRREIMRES